jgi:hypothetical protein
LSVLGIAGTGFSIEGAPPLPMNLASHQAIDFRALFQPVAIASYSAALYSEGISVILTATVQPRLTPLVETASGFQTLGNTAVDFGSVELGSVSTRNFVLENRTATPMIAPAISVQGDGFALAGTSPGGTILNTGQNVPFAIEFRPAQAGSSDGSLQIGDRLYALHGDATAIPLPKPSLDLTNAGTVRIVFDAPARSPGSGSIVLSLRPLAAGATDGAIQFAAGGRSLNFTFAAGDRQLEFPYASGTTAGTVAFTVTLGKETAAGSVSIAAAPVTIVSVSGTRGANSIQLQITAIDNTRTVGPVTYTFYDASGNTVPPGALRVDSTADFAKFFQSSDAGGNFLLRSIFPVTGDTSRITAFEVEIGNTAGSTKTGRTNF